MAAKFFSAPFPRGAARVGFSLEKQAQKSTPAGTAEIFFATADSLNFFPDRPMKVWAILARKLMAGLQLSGLASGFDWKSLVDQLMDLERAPISRIEAEQRTNTQRATALSDLGTRLASLKNAAAALKDVGVFSGRKAASSAGTGAWTAASAAGGATGSYTISVTQLATTARREGAGDIAAGLHDDADVSGLTLATLRTGTAVTAGSFSVNGQKINVLLTDSLQDVFDKIATATGDDVTASYDPLADQVTLASAGGSPITLGAANDSSNFLRVFKLAHNGTDTVTTTGTLGALKTTAKLADAGLRGTIDNLDENGAGTFTINGVDIAYNVNTDTLTGVIKRINAAGAGVTASYDALNDRMVLTNNQTGDVGLSVSENGTGLLSALGLASGATSVAGRNAIFSVNDGPALTNPGNDLDATAHGIAGLTVNVNSEGTQTITVQADTDGMRAKIDAFVTAYNQVQQFIEDRTKVTTSNGKVTAAVLSANREVQEWARDLRSLAFSTFSGIGGAITSLEKLGLGFSGTSLSLGVRDEAKLTAALRDNAGDVESFFQTASSGFASRFESVIGRLVTSGEGQQARLTKANNDLTRQIGDLERRLVQQRELLTSSFIKMEEAQQRINTQGTALTNAFFQNNTK